MKGIVTPGKAIFFLFISFSFCFDRYGMKYVAMTLREALSTKFPDASEDDILKVCFFVDPCHVSKCSSLYPTDETNRRLRLR